jgi:hypothetical protein
VVEGAYAVVTIDSTGVTLSGKMESGGTLHVPLSRIRLASAGFTESKSARLYELRLWVDGLPRPLQLCPHGVANHGPYKATVHALAAAMAEQGTLQRMHTGVSRFPLRSSVKQLMASRGHCGVPRAGSGDRAAMTWWHYIVIPKSSDFIRHAEVTGGHHRKRSQAPAAPIGRMTVNTNNSRP